VLPNFGNALTHMLYRVYRATLLFIFYVFSCDTQQCCQYHGKKIMLSFTKTECPQEQNFQIFEKPSRVLHSLFIYH
jgi:hypothetical protein